MKRFFAALVMAGFIATPLAAQGAVEGQVDDKDLSVEELQAKLGKLMKQASEEMAALEKELARASLAAPKADVVAERIKQIRAAMEQGKLDELPDGLREEIKQNPDDVAKATGKTAEEVVKIAESQQELQALLRQNPDVLKRLAQSEDVMQRVLEKQSAVEKRLAETLKKTEESAESTRKNVNDAIDVAHVLKSKCP